MSILTTSYQIPPLTKKFDTQVTLPGSKSIALRQLAISALVDGKTILSGIPECDDIDAMIECLGTLGVRIQRTKNELEISGPIDLSDKTVSINTRMSGASTRILIGLAALRKGLTRIDGHESLRKRTNEPLLKTLEQMGCIVKREGVGLPVEIRGPVMSPELEIAGNISSQYVTALLLISPFLNQEEGVAIKIKGDLVSKPYRYHGKRDAQKRFTSQMEWITRSSSRVRSLLGWGIFNRGRCNSRELLFSASNNP